MVRAVAVGLVALGIVLGGQASASPVGRARAAARCANAITGAIDAEFSEDDETKALGIMGGMSDRCVRVAAKTEDAMNHHYVTLDESYDTAAENVIVETLVPEVSRAYRISEDRFWATYGAMYS